MEHGRVTRAKSQLLEKTQSNLEFNLEFNRKENRLIWNGSVDDLEKFFKYINVMNGDDSILTVNTNAKRFMFKFPMATVNFFPTTKTLQIQGKSACDLRNKLIDYSNERNCSDNPADAPNFVETLEDLEDLEDSHYGLSELESFIDFAMEETSKDFPNSAVEETSQVFPNSVSNIGYGDELKEIWKAIDVIYSKINVIIEEKSAFPSTSSTKSPEELLTIENLSSENDLLKGKLREMEFELQRTKEENLSLITALKVISNNSSVPTKTTDDNSPRSHIRSKLHFTSPVERCPLQTSNPFEVPQEARENQSSSKSFDNQIDDYRAKQKNLYAERCSLQTCNPIEVPQEARENQSSSKSLDNQIDDYRAKQKNSYEEIKGSTGHRASKYDIPIISIDQQPSRTVHSTTQLLKGATKETRKSKKSRKSKKQKSKLKIDSSADTIETNTVRDVSAPTTSENSPVSDSTSAPNTSVLIGDSMLKHIQGWKLGRQAGHRVVVKSFAGATTSDMSHYVKPTIAKNPDEILIHVGTNDVGKLQPHTIAENIVDLASFITSESVSRVVISELITRADDSSKEAVKEVNRRLRQFCGQRGYRIIRHDNITAAELNRGGLHLNEAGTNTLFNNFANYLSKH